MNIIEDQASEYGTYNLRMAVAYGKASKIFSTIKSSENVPCQKRKHSFAAKSNQNSKNKQNEMK